MTAGIIIIVYYAMEAATYSNANIRHKTQNIKTIIFKAIN